MPLSQRLMVVLLMFLVSLPGLLMTLFQMTCMVTGSAKAWWCGAYSWFVSALVMLYSTLLVVVVIMSLASGGKVLQDIARNDIDAFQATQMASGMPEPVPSEEMPAEGPAEAPAGVDEFKVYGESSVPAPIEPFDDKNEEYEEFNAS